MASTFNSTFIRLIEQLGKKATTPELIDQCMVGLEASLMKFDFNKSFVLEELLGFIKCEVFDHIEEYDLQKRKEKAKDRKSRQINESSSTKKKPGRVDYRSQEIVDYFLQSNHLVFKALPKFSVLYLKIHLVFRYLKAKLLPMP